LHTNVRNARGIARLARTKLGGAEAPQSLPATQDVGFVEAATQEALVARVSELLQSSLESGIAQRDILVIASDSSTRDALRDQLKLTSATDERIGAIACETPYRSKGLEYPIVILAIGEKSMSRAERYVAVTRAIQSLTVIARSSELLEFGAAG
jgi:superfamily I DNA/RNA helicase